MSRKCELTGKAVMSGNNVSHSERKTRRRFLPNLHKVTLASDALSQSFSFRISMNALKTIEIKGGLDKFLLSVSSCKLSKSANDVRKKIVSKLKESA
jgi:large subunit ribosomal protein L28